MDNNYKITDEQIAIGLAEKLYENFFNELMTGMRNSIKNFEGAMWSRCDGPAIAYNQGKMHAFKEISERLVKEYQLVLNNQLHCDEVCHSMINEIKYKKNEELDKVFPDRKYCSTRFGHIIMQLKGKLANLLEGYGVEGFRLGMLFGRNENKETEEFDPVSFEKLCDDTFVDDYYMSAIRYVEDREYKKEVDAKLLFLQDAIKDEPNHNTSTNK